MALVATPCFASQSVIGLGIRIHRHINIIIYYSTIDDLYQYAEQSTLYKNYSTLSSGLSFSASSLIRVVFQFDQGGILSGWFFN